MEEQIGEQLTQLKSGDSVVITIDGDRFDGNVTDTERRMCELVSGFMESGSVSIYLELSAETVERGDLSTEYLLITATENVPQNWNEPLASLYDPTEDETIAKVGTVDEVRVMDGSLG